MRWHTLVLRFGPLALLAIAAGVAFVGHLLIG